VLDTVIGLRRPADYVADQGARFEITIEKGRGIYGDDARSSEARYEEQDGAAVWTRTEITEAELLKVTAAIRNGLSIREAADELEMSKSKVGRLRDQARQKGMLDG
jgi:putative DNA primase/helicase